MKKKLKVLRENHDLVESGIWVLLAIPTLLFWKDAVVWVALMSLYANAKSAHGAWKADRASREAKEGARKGAEEGAKEK